MENCHLAVHVNLQRYCVRLPTVRATGQSQEGNYHIIQFSMTPVANRVPLADTLRHSNLNLPNKTAYNLALMNSRQNFVNSTRSSVDQIALNNSSLPQRHQIHNITYPLIYPPLSTPPTLNHVVLSPWIIQMSILPPLALSTQAIRMQMLILVSSRLEMLERAGISVLLLEVIFFAYTYVLTV